MPRPLQLSRFAARALLAGCLLFVQAAFALAAERRAVVVGIDDYSATQLRASAGSSSKGRRFVSLGGARNDAVAFAELLQAVYGFEATEVVTLFDQQATRGAILDAIESHLVAPARSGDELLFFFSGHGSRVENPASDEDDRLDETLVPADSAVGAPDIHDKELRALFNLALDRNARLTVILDACHSGSATRGPWFRTRALASPPPRTVSGPFGPRPEERGALILAAAQERQAAGERLDHEREVIRGNFSLALQQAIRASWPGESVQRLFQRTRALLHGAGVDQEPVLAALPEVRSRALLGGRSDRSPAGIVVAVERVRSDGSILLQGGWVTGLSVGSELRPASGSRSGSTPEPGSERWRVVSVEGLARSTARPVPGTSPRRPAPGDLLELERWASRPALRLKLWIPEAGDWRAAARIAAALRKAAGKRGVGWLAEPTWDSRRDLKWSGRGGRSYGAATDVRALAETIAASGSGAVFAHLPIPSELAVSLLPEPGVGFERVADPRAADYHLVSRLRDDTVELAWIRARLNDGPGAGLPGRSGWIAAGDDVERSGQALRLAATRLGRIAAWLRLESPPFDRFPYELVLAPSGEEGRDLLGGTLRVGEEYDLWLRLRQDWPAGAEVERRYVYVLAIDSNGRGTLLFPRLANVENHLPVAGKVPERLPLGRRPSLRIAPPLGTDVFLLLASEQPLPNIFALEFEAVRAAPAGRSALVELLEQAVGKRRSAPVETADSWAVQRLFFSTEAGR